MPGTSCDDGVPCTIDNRCQQSGVCLGLHDGSTAACGVCDVDCATQCAPCCTMTSLTNPATCVTGCGPCVRACSDGCDAICQPQTSCSLFAFGGGAGAACTLRCDGVDVGCAPGTVCTCP